jgi:hypothetical protein
VGKLYVFDVGGQQVTPDCRRAFQHQQGVYPCGAKSPRLRSKRLEGVIHARFSCR